MKTLAELNSKWWWRLLKVIIALILLFFVFILWYKQFLPWFTVGDGIPQIFRDYDLSMIYQYIVGTILLVPISLLLSFHLLYYIIIGKFNPEK